MATDTFMCKWRLCTDDLVARGAMFEVAKHGMLLAVFSPQNKLRSLELSFDVMSFMQQLKRATVRTTFLVCPQISTIVLIIVTDYYPMYMVII